MILALLLGWLPGPGGIPLFIVGLSLLAINHDWAKRYILILKKQADNIGDFVFVDKPLVQLFYDIVAPVGLATGVVLLFRHSALWMISLGVFLVFIGFTFLLGNRKRWQRLRRHLNR